MYSTCLFCNAPLGANDVIEIFPVGRRLAFDEAKGRLWVVCAVCGRWNLTPLEERWEAIEDCERRYRATRLRVSTDNIGLGKLREGLELVRIGQPLRPEFAAWRYGDRLVRRRVRAIASDAMALSAYATMFTVAGISEFLIAPTVGGRIMDWYEDRLDERIAAYLPSPDGGRLIVRRKHLPEVRIHHGGDAIWLVRVPHDRGATEFVGPDGARAIGLLLTRINAAGATASDVGKAVLAIERAGDAAMYVSHITGVAQRHGFLRGAPLAEFSSFTRLALEMAAHEDAERRAMEGELATLEAAWRQAEEIAAIADTLLLPSVVEDWIRRRRTDASN